MNTATLDHAAGAAAKAAGMQLALTFAGDWKDEILDEFRAWIAVQKARGEREISVEQFRAHTKLQPTSHKCWGSVPGMACKDGLIAPLLDEHGRRVYRPAASPKTHAHPVCVWKVL